MGKLTLITGGVRSGKSGFAEKLAAGHGGKTVYIATAIAFDAEMTDRIRIHKNRRPANWETIELPYGIPKDPLPEEQNVLGALKSAAVVLLDCITVLVSNIMLREIENWDDAGTEDVERVRCKVFGQIDEIAGLAERYPADVLIVTNEVGMGLVPPYALGRAFRDFSGSANQRLAQTAESVYLCVAGIPVKIK